MAMVPGVVVSGSVGEDIGVGSTGCASFDAGDNMQLYIEIGGKRPTAAETGVDRKHWRVVFTNPRPEASSRQETIKLSLRLLAKVVGKKRALTSLYGVNDLDFGCQVSEEEGREFLFLDGVRCSFFDGYICGPNREYLRGVYSHPEEKFPGPDDDLSEYRRYLDDWKPADSEESKERMVRYTLRCMWREAFKDGFTLVTSKKSNFIKQVMEKEGNQATKEQVKLALEMHTLRKCAEQAVDREARALEKKDKEYQALRKEVLEIQVKRREALEMQKQALGQEAEYVRNFLKEILRN